MSYRTKILIFMLVTLFASSVFAAGDYIWEGRFKKELPKAEKGDVKAQYEVGEMYEKGKGAVKDVQKAFDWYLKAANQKDDKAAYKVGLFYYEGIAVKRDYDKAFTWFSRSAEQDYVRAQYYLGELYENGHGAPKDSDTALKWYKRALAGGYNPAADSIERVTKSIAALRAASKKSRFIKRPKEPLKPATKSTKSIVLAGGWKKGKRPAEYLPSDVTKCVSKGVRVECDSKDLKRNIGMADISYTTKAILFSFGGDKQFKISYRNKVSKIKVTDEDFAESGEKVPVKLGWQDAEHKLACEVENDKSIICTKNKVRTIKLTR